MRNVWVSTDVVTEPVTSTEAKLFCKVSGTTDDTIFTLLIKQARETLEQGCNISLAEKTLIAEYDKLPRDGKIKLPYGPVKSVTSVITIDEEDEETTLVNNTEWYDTGYPWPTLRIASFWSGRIQKIKVTYVVGYGATGCPALPAPLKVAILKEVLAQYYVREGIAGGDLVNALRREARELSNHYSRNLFFAPEA